MKTALIAGAFLCAYGTSFAEELPVYNLQTVVTTPQRFSAPQAASPSNVTIITAQDIQNSGARTIPELLAQQAGIHARSTDGTPDVAIDIRGFGMSGNQNSVVLLDGLKINDIDLSAVRWSTIPLEAIARIEIIRGSGSVLYGEGATGGVINIITKAPSKTTLGQVALGFGSYRTVDLQASFSMGSDNQAVRITADAYNSDGYRRNNEDLERSLLGDWRIDIPHGYLNLKFGADHQNLRFPGARTVDPTLGINELENDRRGTSTPANYGLRDGGILGLTYAHSAGDAEFATDVLYRKKQTEAILGSYVKADLAVAEIAPRLKLAHSILGGSGSLVLGMQASHWDYDQLRATTSATAATPTAHVYATQKNRAAYLQETVNFATTSISLGARRHFVDYQATDVVNTAPYAQASKSYVLNAAEAGLRQKLGAGVALFGKIGRSFRLATVDESYDQYGGPFFDSSVSLLEPQTSYTKEIGIDFQTPASQLRATYFRIDSRNEIHYNALTFTNMNLAPTRRNGTELEGKWKLNESWRAFANYSYTVAKFREGTYGGVDVAGNMVPLVPKTTFTLGATWRMNPHTRLNGSATYTGKQYFDNDQANDFGQQMPAYTVADLKFTHEIQNWVFEAAINNIFDKKYYSYGIRSNFTPGRYNVYPMPERNFWLGATYHFK